MQDEATAATDIWRAHWRRRLAEDGNEKWLQISAADAPAMIAEGIVAAIEEPLRELSEHATDSALRDVWISGNSPGLTNTQRLLYLSVLLNEIGPPERLQDVLAELNLSTIGTGHAAVVMQRLVLAGVKVQ